MHGDRETDRQEQWVIKYTSGREMMNTWIQAETWVQRERNKLGRCEEGRTHDAYEGLAVEEQR